MRLGRNRASLTSAGAILVFQVVLEISMPRELTAERIFYPWDFFLRPTLHAAGPAFYEQGPRVSVEKLAPSRVKRRSGVAYLLADAAAAMLASGAPGAASAAAAPAAEVQMYFGQGRFWRLQHELAMLEQRSSSSRVTATSGYAGGGPARAPKQQACFHNLEFPLRDYTQLGHAEVVRLEVPREEVARVSKAYFDLVSAALPAGRPDGGAPAENNEYRCLIGLPGGANSSIFPDILAANGDRLLLAVGQGSDPDTLGSNLVWIYDSDSFPFYQAELYNQFHDEVGTKYPQEYHQLQEAFLREGRLQKVNCPEQELSENGEDVPSPEDMVSGFTLGGTGDDPFGMIFGNADYWAQMGKNPRPRNKKKAAPDLQPIEGSAP